MAGFCIEKLPHSCGSSDGLQVFEKEGGYSGYCFACETYVPHPYGNNEPNIKKPNKKSEEQIKEELEEIASLPTVDLPDRFLRKESLDYFGVKIGLSEQDGSTPILQYYPYATDGVFTGYKVRLIPNKMFWCIPSIKGADLFGWDKAILTGAKKLFITEGENDAIALYQALKDKNQGTPYAIHHPAVVSLTSGASSARRELVTQMPKIKQYFKEVVLVFDNDEPGKAATDSVVQVFPAVKVAVYPSGCKDPNDAVMQGKSTALANSVLFNSDVPKNTRLVWGQSLYEASREPAQWGLSWPWDGMTKYTRGIRFGETVYLGAGVKLGKSEVVNTLAAHLMIEHDLKVFLAKPEEANKKTIKMVLGKVVGKIFHDPNIEFDNIAYDEAAKKVGNRLCMLSLYQHLGWETLKADIIAAAHAGCKAVFIDPITNVVNGISAAETDTVLKEIAQELAAMAKDLDIVVFIFCHLKAPVSGDPHERGGKVFSSQFAGSRAMMRSCNYMLGLEGNKDPDLPEEQRNMRKLIILEDREFGASGYVNLYWDKNTGLFNEVKE